MSKTGLKKVILFFSVFYLGIIIAFWLATPVGDDMMFHLLRVGELGREMKRDNAIPVYMYRDVYYNYGYPIPIFYCSLFLYPFAFLVRLGMREILAYKIMITAVFIATFVVSYCCLLRWKRDNELAFAGAIVFGLQPYFLIDLFVRSAIGEAFVFVFIPIVLLGFLLVFYGVNNLEAILCLAVGMMGVICSHVISTFLVLSVLLCMFAFMCFKGQINGRVIFRILSAAFICLMLSLWYVAPLLEQLVTMEFRAEKVNDLASGTVGIVSLIIPMHMNLVLSSILHIDLQPSQIGGATFIMIAFVVYNAIIGKLRKLPSKVKCLMVLYCFGIAILMMPFVWNLLGGIIGFIQFPWRIYIIISVIGTSIMILSLDTVREQSYYRGIMSICAVSASFVLITIFMYFMLRGTLYTITGGKIGEPSSGIEYSKETSDDLYLSKKVTYNLSDRKRIVSIQDEGELECEYDIDSEKGQVELLISGNQNDSDIWVEFPFLMYKGYRASNESNMAVYEIRMSQNGLVEVKIPAKAVGRIVVSYYGTIVQRISFYISTISVLLLLTVWLTKTVIHLISCKDYRNND